MLNGQFYNGDHQGQADGGSDDVVDEALTMPSTASGSRDSATTKPRILPSSPTM
jgi:hypothetical protein